MIADEGKIELAQAREHTARGDLVRAVAGYRKALEVGVYGDDRCIALAGLGSALVQLGRMEEARPVLQTLVGDFPDRPRVRVLFRDLARSMSRDEFAETFDFPFLLATAPAPSGDAALSAGRGDDETVLESGAPAMAAQPTGDGVLEALPLRPNWGQDEASEWARANFEQYEITVGRAQSNDVVLTAPGVSKLHAVFHFADGRWEIADSGSRNGTFVGERRLFPEDANVPLASGEIVSFGQARYLFVTAPELWDRLTRR